MKLHSSRKLAVALLSKSVLPFSFALGFYELLARNRDLIEVITYNDLYWSDGDNFKDSYLDEKRRWDEALRKGELDPDKVYVLVQHDVDDFPEATHASVRSQLELGIKSNIMIHNKFVDRRHLSREGEVRFKSYDLDLDLLRRAEQAGSVLGYHQNALEQTLFDDEAAHKVFEEDVAALKKNFNIRFFSPHGGVRGPNGYSNAGFEPRAPLGEDLRWVHNRYTARFEKSYSDGGLAGSKLDLKDRDPRQLVQAFKRGGRYRFLLHPQYYFTPFHCPDRFREVDWCNEVLQNDERGLPPEHIWPDRLLEGARASVSIRRDGGKSKAVEPAKKLVHKAMPKKTREPDMTSVSVHKNASKFTSQHDAIIIGGDGRSGTTLLSVMLDSHPGLFVGGELHFTSSVLPNLGSYILETLARLAAEEPREIAWRSTPEWKPGVQFIARCNRFGISNPDLKSVIEATMASVGEITDFDKRCALVEQIGQFMASAADKTRWGFKIMREIRNPARYATIWPNSKFLHIIRDGRDVAASQISEHGSWGYNDIEDAARNWVKLIQDARRNAADLEYLEVRYEDLVTNAAAACRQMVEFLDIEWSEDILNHHLADHALVQSKVAHPSKAQVAKPRNSSSIGRYQRDLDAEQIAVFEKVAGEMLRELRYEVQGG